MSEFSEDENCDDIPLCLREDASTTSNSLIPEKSKAVYEQTYLLANAGANITTIKRHGSWRSSQVAEIYIEDKA